MARIGWEQVPAEIRDAVCAHTGPVITAHTASEGFNSEIAAVLQTAAGPVFVKGRPAGRSAVTQCREAVINPFVRQVAPRLLWHLDTGNWHVLVFEHVQGHHADYTPGSDHLGLVVDLLRQLATIDCPDRPEIKRAEQRWTEHLDAPDAAEHFVGDTLLHTDLNPRNVLIHGSTARLIDWAWPTKGAAFIDPACWIVRLIAAGHTPQSAERWARHCPGYAAADHAVTLFALATHRMWEQIAQHEPVPWKQHMATAARTWLAYRQQGRSSPSFERAAS
jgi:hypothetical protein